MSKSALKEKGQDKSAPGNTKGGQQNKIKDIDKFNLYFDFTCNVQRIQPHQVVNLHLSLDTNQNGFPNVFYAFKLCKISDVLFNLLHF